MRGRVELRAVSYRYPGADRDALDGCSLAVAPGETVALVGPSGAGKTTVTRLLLRFADPTRGRVLLDGHDVRDVRLRDLRAHVTVLAQETLLFEGTVRDNVAYGRHDADAAAIARVAAAVGLEALLDARVGQRGRALSGGQRQRVAIARALLRDSAVVVLDEPTTGLDATSRDAVLEAIDTLRRGRTTVLVSHDPAVIARADRVVELVAPDGTDGRSAHAGMAAQRAGVAPADPTAEATT